MERRHSGMGGEYVFRLKTDGGHRWVLATAKPLLDSKGVYQGTFEMILDISPIKEIEGELRKEIAKSGIYADLVGHDLYNQLQIALGLLEMLNEKVDDRNRQLVSKVVQAIKKSTMLVDEFKSQYDIKTYIPQSVPTDLGQAVSDAINDFSRVTGRELNIHYAPGPGCRVMANRLLKDLFSGLIGHAIKRTTGQVAIWIRLDEVKREGKDYCRVTIEDNGPGMSHAEKKYLFEQYGMEGEKAKGMGFSFYFIKLLIEDFNGIVSVEDRVPGDYTKGSRFTVMFPKVVA
jgi:signal transduction histidine kinase